MSVIQGFLKEKVQRPLELPARQKILINNFCYHTPEQQQVLSIKLAEHSKDPSSTGIK